mgnify:CR=1 FL=1
MLQSCMRQTAAKMCFFFPFYHSDFPNGETPTNVSDRRSNVRRDQFWTATKKILREIQLLSAVNERNLHLFGRKKEKEKFFHTGKKLTCRGRHE